MVCRSISLFPDCELPSLGLALSGGSYEYNPKETQKEMANTLGSMFVFYTCENKELSPNRCVKLWTEVMTDW